MKKAFCLLGLMALTLTGALGQAASYQQWELMYITPKADKVDLFKKALAAHNKKYHPAGAYHASVASVVSGPNTGQFIWIMGPSTWTQMDSRPGAGEHQLDWDKTVGIHVERYGETQYWRLNADVNYTPEGAQGFAKGRDRFFDIRPGQGDRFVEQIKKVMEVYKQKKYPRGYALYERVGATRGSEAVVGVTFNKWADLDNTSNFRADFESVHGAGSFDRFLEEFEMAVDGTRTFDELYEWMNDLGG